MFNFTELKHLSKRYANLRDLTGGITEQRRGQEFNKLIADVLGAHGVEARSSLRRKLGEIDVYFALGGVRYILEAKWESTPINESAVMKLSRRVQQSMAGTRGILLSMSGFTDEAIRGANHSRQLDLVLAEAEHLEAVLAGVMTPEELVDSLIDYASFLGEPTAPLIDLLTDNSHTSVNDEVAFGPYPECPDDIVKVGEMTALRILTQRDYSQYGVAVRPDGRLILTTGRGLIEVDEKRKCLKWLLHSRWCQNSAAVLTDGRVAVVRRAGVVTIGPDGLKVAGGALTGNSRVFVGPNDELWAIENGSHYQQPQAPVALTRFGRSIGDETTYNISGVAAPSSMTGVTSVGSSLLLLTQQGITRFDQLDRTPMEEVLSRPTSLVNPGGLTVVDNCRIFGIGNEVSVHEFAFESLDESVTAELDLGGSTYDIASGPLGSLIVTAPCRHSAELPHQAIIRLKPK